jgi:hypothetical protein
MRKECLASAPKRVDVMQGLCFINTTPSIAGISSCPTDCLDGMAQPALPDDILHVLCEELANQDQFDTLFNCACASRALAVPALTYLYRYVPGVSTQHRFSLYSFKMIYG